MNIKYGRKISKTDCWFKWSKWSKFDKCRCFLGLKIIFNIIIYKYFAIKSKNAKAMSVSNKLQL